MKRSSNATIAVTMAVFLMLAFYELARSIYLFSTGEMRHSLVVFIMSGLYIKAYNLLEEFLEERRSR